jgi:hypothetical protein
LKALVEIVLGKNFSLLQSAAPRRIKTVQRHEMQQTFSAPICCASLQWFLAVGGD